MGISAGSVIRLAQSGKEARWEATVKAQLPSAPYTVSLRQDGTMLVTLSSALVSIEPDRSIHTLLADAPWVGLYPNSSTLLDERLYIGMRQFVGEFDLRTNRFRLLIPSKEFLNKLPKEDEKRIRKQYGG